mgnify:FL=1
MNEIINKYLTDIKKITYKKDYSIIETSTNKKYIIIKKIKNKEKLYDYLTSINYNLYKKPLNINDKYEIFSLDDLEEESITNALITLHYLTEEFRDCSEEDLKKIKEKIMFNLDKCYKYYLNIQDEIENMSFPPPDKYLLINNISQIYKLLEVSKYRLDNLKLNSLREVILINNFDNNIFKNIIDFNYYSKDIFVYDLEKLYKKDYKNFKDLLKKYNDKLKISKEEWNLLSILISIPEEVTLENNHYNDCIKIRNLINYVNYTFSFLSEEDEKYKETDKQELEEENENI